MNAEPVSLEQETSAAGPGQPEPREVVIGVGSNCGDRDAAMADAIRELLGLLSGGRASSVYETPAAGGGTRPYLNAVVAGVTTLPDAELNRRLKRYEVLHGRDLASRLRGDVPIDLDLVLSGGEVVRPRDFSQRFFRIGYEELHS